MENEQMVEQMLALVEQLLQVAGPEWTMEFLQGGLEMAQQGGGEQTPPDMPPEVMPQGGPGAMPPVAGPLMAPKRGMMGKRIN